MDFLDYTAALERLRHPQKQKPALRAKNTSERQIVRPRAPLKNFFNDDFLTLLYYHTSAETEHSHLRLIKEALNQVADPSLPKHVCANAAVTLGRFVRDKDKGNKSPAKQSHPARWFERARDLGSVVGAWECANTLLIGYKHQVIFDAQADPLPHIYERGPVTENGLTEVMVDPDVSHAWAFGVRTATRHVQRQFKGWTKEEFGCAFACIANYLTIIPGHSYRGRPSPSVTCRQALSWIDPLWKALIKIAPGSVAAPEYVESYRAFLIEQRLAVLSFLTATEQLNSEDASSSDGLLGVYRRGAQRRTAIPGAKEKAEAVRNEWERLSAQARQKVRMLRSAIPVSTERGEQNILDQFDALHMEVPFTELPDLKSIEQIEAALTAEFPWASEPIQTVMDDLYTRRLNGSIRLGLAPVLLVGFPASGKTRFAQRLASLLNTPNTVVNLAGMSDSKLLKGCTRGWAGTRPSRIVEFIQQKFVANPLFILDEIDKVSLGGMNGDPQAALLDLLEPGNAAHYQDIFLMAELDLSHCLYIATANTLNTLYAPLLSRLRPVFFPQPGPEHTPVLVQGMLRDFESAWGLPPEALSITCGQIEVLRGLSPREMRAALLRLLGRGSNAALHRRH